MRRKKPAKGGITLDGRDKAIVAALARDAWLTYAELGEVCHLSPSATQRRVERLKRTGVITGARVCVSPELLDKPIRIYVLVELRDEASPALKALARRLRTEPDVAEAVYVAGAEDLVIVLQVARMKDYAEFAERRLNANPAVLRYRTLTVLWALE